ncbi:MAG TPA: YsnF/AvaK domain-containing protein [Herpetosiphonaceae bacterium]
MDQVYVGMTVEDATGPIGVVESVTDDPTTGAPQVVVQRDDGEIMKLTPGMYMVVGDVLHIDEVEREVGLPADQTTVSGAGIGTSYDPLRTQELSTIGSSTLSQQDLAAGEELRIPVIREEAVVRTREVERGGVRVHKTVNEREEVVEQPTMREDVDVERVAIGRVIDTVPEVREEGDTLIIPVLEEMLVVEKRLVLKEEIRITKRRTTETEQARVVLNEEQVTIERLGEQSVGEQFRPDR